MKITLGCNCNIIPQNNIKNSYSLNFKAPLKHDTVCFRGLDFLDLPEEKIIKKVKESITPENFLGEGIDAKVYRIKNTDYCVRIPHIADKTCRFVFSKELEPTDKVNHVVARLGFGTTIMKYIDGVIPKRYMNENHNRYELQKKIAKMPIKSYSDLLHQIANGIDNEMLFDFSGENLIINTQDKKLTAIDFYSISDYPRQIRPLTEIYSVLTCYGSLKKTGKKIFDKIVNAGLKEFGPNKIPCMDVTLFDFLEICLKRMGDAHTPGCEKIKYKIMYNADKLKKLKKAEIIDKKLTEALKQQLSQFKFLLRKVH